MCAADGRSVAVVGGGWAGCAGAVGLARAGCKVTLFEAARTLGGRARAVDVGGHTLDNGQHILLGAYRETLRLLRQVGIDPAIAFLRLPLQMRYPPNSGGMDFIAPRLPAPWHMAVALLRAKGLAREDKLALARFTTSARWMDWQLNVDSTVSELLERFDQTERLKQLMWHPLCLAALNTPPERASAKVFLAVLRDSLGARRAASDMLLPRLNLCALFPDAAARQIERHHGQVRTGVRIEALARDGEQWLLAGDRFDAVVLATPPNQAARLIDGLPDCAGLAQQLAEFDYEPITTCYLQYAEDVRLSQPMYALDDTHGWGQFVFDRGQLDQGHAGLLSVVISASRDAAELEQDELSAAVASQLSKVLGMPALAAPRWSRVITEKRATFACVPNLPRPDNATYLPGLALAGDYTASDYPATLESAVRSALGATSAILSRRTLPRQNSSLSQSNGDGDDACVQ
jgi:squalene-associated FAD-dependent desaturase